MKRLILALFLSSFLLTACGGEEEAPAAAAAEKEDAPAKGKKGKKGKNSAAEQAAALAAKQEKREKAELALQQNGILVLGDGLSAAEGMASDAGWAGLLQKRLVSLQSTVPVVNASISGDTAGGGASRVGWQLAKFNPRVMVVALGSRDIASNAPVSTIRQGLETIIRTAQANQVAVVLAGVRAPDNAAPEYQAQVNQMYADLARQYQLHFVPDLQAPLTRAAQAAPATGGLAITTSAQAQPAIMETLWPAIEAAMKQAALPVSVKD